MCLLMHAAVCKRFVVVVRDYRGYGGENYNHYD